MPKTLRYYQRPQPDVFHSRTGHTLSPSDSMAYKQLVMTEKYAIENEMEINYNKTKIMLFGPRKSIDFMPAMDIGGDQLE